MRPVSKHVNTKFLEWSEAAQEWKRSVNQASFTDERQAATPRQPGDTLLACLFRMKAVGRYIFFWFALSGDKISTKREEKPVNH